MAENLYKCYKIFIASPGDVGKERKIATEVIYDIGRVIQQTMHCSLIIEHWEASTPTMNRNGAQIPLNEVVRTCDFLILILNKRYGTIETGYTKSNTEREVDAFLENEDNEKRVLSYFKVLPHNPDMGLQEKKVRDLESRLQTLGVLNQSYENLTEFKNKLIHHLYTKILEVHLENSNANLLKKEHLRSFWRFGLKDNERCPEVTIVYPPVRRKWMASDDDEHFWHKRLQPNVFFEDFKAISKIAKMLNIVEIKIKIASYLTYFNTGAVTDANNVIWICIPRLPKIIKRIETEYKKVARFRFVTSQRNNNQGIIKWKSLSGKEIVVKSPLQSYLSIQRKKIDGNSEWNMDLKDVVAKDFAIIARFNKCIPENKARKDEKIKEFFIAGIHGLGTWGATHFLDRHFESFSFGVNDEIQMLVEITYENGRITNCIDVSRKEQSYFTRACSNKTINEIINYYKK